MKGGSRLVEVLPDVGVFAKIGQELETEKDILIPVGTFRMSFMWHALPVSVPGSAEPGGDLGVVQVPRKVQGTSRNSGDWYYCWQIRSDSPGSHVWLTRPWSCFEIGWRSCRRRTLDSTWSTWRSTHSEIVVRLKGDDTILNSDFIEAMGRPVVDNNVSVGVDFERYSSGGSGRGISNDADCTSCVW